MVVGWRFCYSVYVVKIIAKDGSRAAQKFLKK